MVSPSTGGNAASLFFSSIDRLAETAPVPLLAGFLTVCAVILWISYRVSLRFMEKREF